MLNTIKRETPHLFIWICDGKTIKKDELPLPHQEALDYYSTLESECEKLKKTNTPVYLAYIGRLLTEEQRGKMEDLIHNPVFHNLFLIDYDEIEEASDKSTYTFQFKEMVKDYVDAFQKQHKPDVGKGGIADIVDMVRLLLLERPTSLRDHLGIKYPARYNVDSVVDGLLYRDFDVLLIKDEMPDIEVDDKVNGFLNSTNFHQLITTIYAECLGKFPNSQETISEVFSQLLNIDRYTQMRKCYFKDKNNSRYVEFIKLCQKIEINPFNIFSGIIAEENSLLAVSEDNHSIIIPALQETLQKKSPFAALKNAIRSNFRDYDPVSSGLKIELIFYIGNDMTWKREQVSETAQDPVEDPTQSYEPNNSVFVQKSKINKYKGAIAGVIVGTACVAFTLPLLLLKKPQVLQAVRNSLNIAIPVIILSGLALITLSAVVGSILNLSEEKKGVVKVEPLHNTNGIQDMI